jgi:hypothetical protein
MMGFPGLLPAQSRSKLDRNAAAFPTYWPWLASRCNRGFVFASNSVICQETIA